MLGGDNIVGIITKGIGGFYYVATEGSAGTVECRARGVFRKGGITPLTGDKVEISVEETAGKTCKGVVDKILPRDNLLIRPPVANVTQMAVVVATVTPKPNFFGIDKLTVTALSKGIKVLICINKIDLSGSAEIEEIYTAAGFDVLRLSAEEGLNIDALLEKLEGNVTVFAGNSGVGKSSLLNCILGSDALETGELSEKISRGKNTTRHSEILKPERVNSGYVIDTPGFSSFDVSDITAESLERYFPEFAAALGECYFTGCGHTGVKGCRVEEMVESGAIPRSRYDSYIQIYEVLKEIKPWEKK